MNVKNVFLRKAQYRLAEEDWFVLALARQLVAGKIRNQRTMLQRNHVEPRAVTLQQMKTMAEKAEQAQNIEELLGNRGQCRAALFWRFRGHDQDVTTMTMSRSSSSSTFRTENRRPPRDAVNAHAVVRL